MASALSFLLRAIVGVALAHLLWIPLAEPVLVLVSKAALFTLSWLPTPPLVTALEVTGDTVDVRGILFEPLQWMGRWDASNLPLFTVVALGVAAAVPVRDMLLRLTLIGMTLLACYLVMVGIAVVQVLTIAVTWVHAGPGLMLFDESERRLVEEANQAINLLELLLPASVGVFAYVSMLADRETDARPTSPWWPVLAWTLLPLVVFLTTRPVPVARPLDRLARLERTASLNPDSGEIWLAVGDAALRLPTAPGALAAYRKALGAGADAHASGIGIARTFLATQRPQEALAAAGAALAAGPASPILIEVEGRALAQLGRPCEGFERVRRGLTARRGKLPAPELERVGRELARACRKQPSAAGTLR